VGFKTGLERNNVLIQMPVPIFDISDLIKNDKSDGTQIQQVNFLCVRSLIED
jgi:hypothetical protein